MRLKYSLAWLGVLVFSGITSVIANIVLEVTTYPARVFQYAPPGTPVVRIYGYDLQGNKLDGMYLSPGVNSSYFKVDVHTGLLSVAKPIEWKVGTVLSFFVYGSVGTQVNYKHVKIIVSARNMFAPKFTRTNYDFKVYRYTSEKEKVGAVTAQDYDTESYNRVFKYVIDDERGDTYFKVSSNGELTLKSSPPSSVQNLTFSILAVDEGSPKLTGRTSVYIEVQDVKQPHIFCFATELNSTTLCWKNPMWDRPEVSRFEVEITGAMTTTLSVFAGIREKEICQLIPNTTMAQQYFYRVSVGTRSSLARSHLKIQINTSGIGFTPQCLHNDFDSCKYLKPCRNGASCRRQEDGAVNYRCECTEGWQGKNCTLQDLCPRRPCFNGACEFKGHQQYRCSCYENYYGLNCRHFNECTSDPCKNSGQCEMDQFGRYSCRCPDHFTGRNCQLKDPCNPSPCFNKAPCRARGEEAFECACTSGYYGRTCSKTNRCVTGTPCKNGGTCLHTGNNTFTCQCLPGFTGLDCTRFDPCSTSPCRNNATCVLKETGTYDCVCLPGYHGDECQNFNKCYQVDCNKGRCVQTREGQTCDCDLGYSGPRCETYNPCLGEKPCGLTGTCSSPSNGTFECTCGPEWYGLQCQYLNVCSLVNCDNNGVCENTPSSEDGNFTCRCQEGYYGDTCSMYNPCVTSPCVHGYCLNTSSTEYTCDCNDGYYGKDCEIKSPCSEATCLNKGVCRNISALDFECDCPWEFTGKRCDVNNPCFINPCAHNGTCTVNHDTFQASCQCSVHYTDLHCETPVCNDNTCLNGGTCKEGQCTCNSLYTGDRCETPVACENNPCPDAQLCQIVGDGYMCVCANGADNDQCTKDCLEETTKDETGLYTWPKTRRGHQVLLQCKVQPPSSDQGRPMVSRTCLKQGHVNAKWSQVNSSQCVELGLAAAGKKLNELKSLTSDPSKISAKQLANYTNVLEEVFPYSLNNNEIVDTMTDVVSNLADVNASIIEVSDRDNNTSNRLVILLKNYTASTKNTKDIASSNINMKAVDVPASSTDPITFEPQLLEGNQSIESGISITLPSEVLHAVGNGLPLRVQFIGFKKATFFIETNGPKESLDEQRVITTIIKDVPIQNLSTPIVYTISNIQSDRNHSCVYWDPESGSWAHDGITTIRHDDNTTECHTTHLTSFAILMDPNLHHQRSAKHEKILSVVSYVGCGLSIIGLVLTLLTYGLFRCLNKDKSGKILINLCVAMLLLNVSFLLGSQSSDTYGLCIAVAALLHYFLLTTLMWMLVEAVEMYQALVTVFAKYARFYMTKRCVAAWGIPLIIVVITLSVNVENYKPPADFCFISQSNPVAYYAALLTPGCLVFLTNTIVFILVARVILKPRFQQQQREDKERVTPAQVRGAFTVMILLGVTWIFGPIAVNEASLVFNYIFCIFNSLQGFLIFVFRCLFNPEARLAWIQLVKTGTLKSRRGPIKSVYSETSSKGDNSKSRTNGHFGGTLKSNIMQTNGWHHPKLNGLAQDEDDDARRDTQYFVMHQGSQDNVFHSKDALYLDGGTPPTRSTDMLEDGFTHL